MIMMMMMMMLLRRRLPLIVTVFATIFIFMSVMSV